MTNISNIFLRIVSRIYRHTLFFTINMKNFFRRFFYTIYCSIYAWRNSLSVDKIILLCAAFFTLLTTTMSLYAFGTVEEEHIGAYGSFFSGISSALAFIWIIAGYLLQNFELRETRKILKNQQATLQRSARAADRETYKELLLPALNSISHSISELINLLKLENIYGNDNDELPDISLEYILEQIQDTPNFYEHLARAVDNSIPSPVGYAVSQLEFSITTLQEKIDDLEDRDIILSSHRSLSLLNTMKKRLQEISGGQ